MKAVILASQRSGSTFLAKALNAHSQIRCAHAELFLRGSLSERLPLVWQAGGQLEHPARVLHVLGDAHDGFDARCVGPRDDRVQIVGEAGIGEMGVTIDHDSVPCRAWLRRPRMRGLDADPR